MPCPIFNSYAKVVVRECARADTHLYDNFKDRVEHTIRMESLARDLSKPVSRLRAFYLARVLCMRHCPDVLSSVYSELDMDEVGAAGLVKLGEEGEQSWTGLSRSMEHLTALLDEVRIELTSVLLMRDDPTAPLLEGRLVVARDVLESSLKALGILREELNHELLGKRFSSFIHQVVVVEDVLHVPLPERAAYLDDLRRITAASTIVPTRKEDPCPFQIRE